MGYCQIEPILALRLTSFGLSNSFVGLFFCIIPIFYILGGYIIQYQPKWMPNRVILVTCAFLYFIGLVMGGPSRMLPNKLWIMGVGHAIQGIANSGMIVPSLPDMIIQAKKIFP